MDFRNPPQWRRPFPELYADLMAQVRYAELLGYDNVWLTEHHFCEDGHAPSILPLAAAVAARTRTIRIGTGVLLLPLHNAVRVAEDGATIDILSNVVKRLQNYMHRYIDQTDERVSQGELPLVGGKEYH